MDRPQRPLYLRDPAHDGGLAAHHDEPGSAAGGVESRKNVETTWGALTMRWGGVLLAIFIVFHLFHFTEGMVGFRPVGFQHLMVYQNVVAGFQNVPIALFYILAMCALCLHLDHGIWSGLQTLGWVNQDNTKA